MTKWSKKEYLKGRDLKDLWTILRREKGANFMGKKLLASVTIAVFTVTSLPWQLWAASVEEQILRAATLAPPAVSDTPRARAAIAAGLFQRQSHKIDGSEVVSVGEPTVSAGENPVTSFTATTADGASYLLVLGHEFAENEGSIGTGVPAQTYWYKKIKEGGEVKLLDQKHTGADVRVDAGVQIDDLPQIADFHRGAGPYASRFDQFEYERQKLPSEIELEIAQEDLKELLQSQRDLQEAQQRASEEKRELKAQSDTLEQANAELKAAEQKVQQLTQEKQTLEEQKEAAERQLQQEDNPKYLAFLQKNDANYTAADHEVIARLIRSWDTTNQIKAKHDTGYEQLLLGELKPLTDAIMAYLKGGLLNQLVQDNFGGVNPYDWHVDFLLRAIGRDPVAGGEARNALLGALRDELQKPNQLKEDGPIYEFIKTKIASATTSRVARAQNPLTTEIYLGYLDKFGQNINRKLFESGAKTPQILEQEIQEVEDRIQAQQAELDEGLENARQNLQQNAGQLRDVETDLARQSTALGDLEQKIEGREAQIKDLEARVQEDRRTTALLDRAIAPLRHQGEFLRHENDSLRQIILRLERRMIGVQAAQRNQLQLIGLMAGRLGEAPGAGDNRLIEQAQAAIEADRRREERFAEREAALTQADELLTEIRQKRDDVLALSRGTEKGADESLQDQIARVERIIGQVGTALDEIGASNQRLQDIGFEDGEIKQIKESGNVVVTVVGETFDELQSLLENLKKERAAGIIQRKFRERRARQAQAAQEAAEERKRELEEQRRQQQARDQQEREAALQRQQEQEAKEREEKRLREQAARRQVLANAAAARAQRLQQQQEENRLFQNIGGLSDQEKALLVQIRQRVTGLSKFTVAERKTPGDTRSNLIFNVSTEQGGLYRLEVADGKLVDINRKTRETEPVAFPFIPLIEELGLKVKVERRSSRDEIPQDLLFVGGTRAPRTVSFSDSTREADDSGDDSDYGAEFFQAIFPNDSDNDSDDEGEPGGRGEIEEGNTALEASRRRIAAVVVQVQAQEGKEAKVEVVLPQNIQAAQTALQKAENLQSAYNPTDKKASDQEKNAAVDAAVTAGNEAARLIKAFKPNDAELRRLKTDDKRSTRWSARNKKKRAMTALAEKITTLRPALDSIVRDAKTEAKAAREREVKARQTEVKTLVEDVIKDLKSDNNVDLNTSAKRGKRIEDVKAQLGEHDPIIGFLGGHKFNNNNFRKMSAFAQTVIDQRTAFAVQNATFLQGNPSAAEIQAEIKTREGRDIARFGKPLAQLDVKLQSDLFTVTLIQEDLGIGQLEEVLKAVQQRDEKVAAVRRARRQERLERERRRVERLAEAKEKARRAEQARLAREARRVAEQKAVEEERRRQAAAVAAAKTPQTEDKVLETLLAQENNKAAAAERKAKAGEAFNRVKDGDRDGLKNSEEHKSNSLNSRYRQGLLDNITNQQKIMSKNDPLIQQAQEHVNRSDNFFKALVPVLAIVKLRTDNKASNDNFERRLAAIDDSDAKALGALQNLLGDVNTEIDARNKKAEAEGYPRDATLIDHVSLTLMGNDFLFNDLGELQETIQGRVATLEAAKGQQVLKDEAESESEDLKAQDEEQEQQEREEEEEGDSSSDDEEILDGAQVALGRALEEKEEGEQVETAVRLAKEKAERERVEREQAAVAEQRRQEEQQERERQEVEAKAAEKLRQQQERERVERERREAEEKVEHDEESFSSDDEEILDGAQVALGRALEEKEEGEQVETAVRLAKEKAERERVEREQAAVAEQRRQEEQQERERQEVEAKAAEKLRQQQERERVERERREAEEKAERERVERERREAEEKVEHEEESSSSDDEEILDGAQVALGRALTSFLSPSVAGYRINPGTKKATSTRNPNEAALRAVFKAQLLQDPSVEEADLKQSMNAETVFNTHGQNFLAEIKRSQVDRSANIIYQPAGQINTLAQNGWDGKGENITITADLTAQQLALVMDKENNGTGSSAYAAILALETFQAWAKLQKVQFTEDGKTLSANQTKELEKRTVALLAKTMDKKQQGNLDTFLERYANILLAMSTDDSVHEVDQIELGMRVEYLQILKKIIADAYASAKNGKMKSLTLANIGAVTIDSIDRNLANSMDKGIIALMSA